MPDRLQQAAAVHKQHLTPCCEGRRLPLLPWLPVDRALHQTLWVAQCQGAGLPSTCQPKQLPASARQAAGCTATAAARPAAAPHRSAPPAHPSRLSWLQLAQQPPAGSAAGAAAAGRTAAACTARRRLAPHLVPCAWHQQQGLPSVPAAWGHAVLAALPLRLLLLLQDLLLLPLPLSLPASQSC